jgi:DNA polymerase-3 subunit gamma/tau
MSLYTKYRPKKFSDLVGQDHIRDTLLEAVKQNRISHAYLFAGPRGTGKTSAARILAKASNCLTAVKDREESKEISGEPCDKCESCLDIVSGRALDIIEIDAASNRGIDEIRELREQVKFAPARLKRKVYIIDEVHMLTREAFNALLKTLEEPPLHAIFVLATTEPHKVLPTIISRTQRFDFRRVSKEDIILNLKNIVKAEKVKIDEGALDLIAALAEGSHRDAITMLEQIISHSKDTSLEDAEKLLGAAKSEEVIKIIGAIFNSNSEEGLKIAHGMQASGQSMAQLNIAIIEQLRRVFLYLVSGKALFDDTKENTEKIVELAKEFKNSGRSESNIIKMIEIFVEAGTLLKESAYPILPIEMAVVETASFNENPKSLPDRQAGEIRISKSETSPRQDSAGQANSNDQNSKLQVKTSKEEKSSHSEPEVKNPRASEDPSSLAPQDDTVISDDIWKKIIDATKVENNSLAALLRDAKPIGGSDDELIVGVKFKFHRDKISEIQNIQVLEGMLCKVTGQNIRVKCQIADLRPKVSKPATDDELQKAAEEIFKN